MSKMLTFIAGFIAGVYIDQLYKLPRLSIIINKSKEYIESLEKNE